MKLITIVLRSLLPCLLMVMQAHAASGQINADLERQLNLNPFLLLELDRPAVKSFYREREHAPLWFDERGRLSRADELISTIRKAHLHGLEPEEYFLGEIEQRLDRKDIAARIELEMLLTAALYRYANDIYSGRLDPFAIDADWHIPNKRLDTSDLLARLSAQTSITKLLATLTPRQDGYQRLKQQLQLLRDIAATGGWRKLSVSGAPGQVRPGIARLKQRLALEGDLDARVSAYSNEFDAGLRRALRSYQRRHGFAPSGLINAQTLSALNVSIEDRIEQVRLNLERWRWLPRDLGKRHVAVNMTGFELEIIDDEEVVLTMPVVIGKPFQETPAMSGMISSLVYNPYWTLTKNVMWESFIPGQIKDPDYLSKRSIKVFRGWADPVEVDPKTVDWSALHPKHNSPYWMRQDPGPGNALGQIKFLFSNPYRIYLHGSPQKHLFERTVRTYSHGCIRVKNPAKFAEYLQGGPDAKTRTHIASRLDRAYNEKVVLPRAVPVYLMYWTAWVDENGQVNFRDDIYGRDSHLRAKLGELGSNT